MYQLNTVGSVTLRRLSIARILISSDNNKGCALSAVDVEELWLEY